MDTPSRKFIVHNTGDWSRNNADTAATRCEPSVRAFDSLDALDMHPFDRSQFEWMLANGQRCITVGTCVYQVRRD